MSSDGGDGAEAAHRRTIISEYRKKQLNYRELESRFHTVDSSSLAQSPVVPLMQPTHSIRIPQLAAAAALSSSASCHRLLKVGYVLKQSWRFTDADGVGYSAVSGDQNPIHLDADFSCQLAGSDRGRIVHSLLIVSLIPSLIAFQFPGAVYASQSLQFKLPVYIGDEVIAEVKATNIRAIKEKYYVKWATKCYTSKECLVLDGEATTILPEITLSQ